MLQAQTQDLTQETDPTRVGNETSEQTISEVSVDLFDREGAWSAKMPSDEGFITSTTIDGGPDGKTPLPQVDGAPTPEDTKILAVKVEFYRRGMNTFFMVPQRPLPIEGTVKQVTLWVAGRNQPHTLTLLVQDYFGHNFELPFGKLDYLGWRKQSVIIPASPDGHRGIVQSDAYGADRPGLRITGLKVTCDPEYTRGTYYIYLDDMRAVTDLYLSRNRDTDDPNDAW
jgi:hypothetical protein